MYANGTHTTISARNTDDFIQKTQVELENISGWMRINKMSANPKKTEFMIIGHLRRTNKITNIARFKMNGTEIKRAHSFLG